VPLLHEGTELVAGDVHAIEVSIAIHASDFLDLELNFSPALIHGISVQISERYLENSALQAVAGILLACSFIDGSESGCAIIEHCGDLHIVPFLALEGVSSIHKLFREVRRDLTASSSGPSS